MNTELRHWQLRDPAALLADIDSMHPLRPGASLLALVGDASGAQVLRACVPVASDPGDWIEDRGDVLEGAMLGLGLEQWARSREDPKRFPTVVHVLARISRCVARRGDYAVLNGLRYVNGFDNFTAGPLLVTPSGWCDLLEQFGAAEPRCRV